MSKLVYTWCFYRQTVCFYLPTPKNLQQSDGKKSLRTPITDPPFIFFIFNIIIYYYYILLLNFVFYLAPTHTTQSTQDFVGTKKFKEKFWKIKFQKKTNSTRFVNFINIYEKLFWTEVFLSSFSVFAYFYQKEIDEK